jgi:hypothetical protein
MLILRAARLGLAAMLLALGLLHPARAAEIKLLNVGAVEDTKKVTLKFTFSEPVKPDVTYFYTHNYVGLRATGLTFTASQVRQSVPPPSAEAARAYRRVSFVQDKESGEIRLYLMKPLTPADAQVVPYDTYTEVTLLKPFGQAPPEPLATEDAEPEPASEANAEPLVAEAVSEVSSEPDAAPTRADDDEAPPTLRAGSPEPYAVPGAEPLEADPEPAAVIEPEPVIEAEPEVAAQPDPEPAAPDTPQRVGGPSYTDFDLDKVPVNQLVFKGKPFREALVELVADSGYNVVIADDVDNSEVTLNFAQKQLSLKSALDLLAQAFDLTWSLEPDAIVVRAKRQP